ncbi:MAG: 3-methylfumaryl-CoA hydratase [Gammaproteobacteria bacterium]|jgi:3-methylfumaryl-CoA hydratase
MDTLDLQDWVGRQEISFADIIPTQAQAMAAILDWEDTTQPVGQKLPAPWHWLYFLPTPKTSDIDIDGHARRGGFLPPVPLPRRMWAGSRINFHTPLCIGDSTRRVSTIKNVTSKQGGSGELVFVTISHDIYVLEVDLKTERLAISEEQDIVYREVTTSSVPFQKAPSEQPDWSQQVNTDPVLLFRFSALTFNGHRIHYDRSYAIDIEGYDGLVVHGPLTASFLLNLLRNNLPDATLKTFMFRGIRPLMDMGSFMIEGRLERGNVHLRALDANGALVMKAEATISQDHRQRSIMPDLQS